MHDMHILACEVFSIAGPTRPLHSGFSLSRLHESTCSKYWLISGRINAYRNFTFPYLPSIMVKKEKSLRELRPNLCNWNILSYVHHLSAYTSTVLSFLSCASIHFSSFCYSLQCYFLNLQKSIVKSNAAQWLLRKSVSVTISISEDSTGLYLHWFTCCVN